MNGHQYTRNHLNLQHAWNTGIGDYQKDAQNYAAQHEKFSDNNSAENAQHSSVPRQEEYNRNLVSEIGQPLPHDYHERRGNALNDMNHAGINTQDNYTPYKNHEVLKKTSGKGDFGVSRDGVDNVRHNNSPVFVHETFNSSSMTDRYYDINGNVSEYRHLIANSNDLNYTHRHENGYSHYIDPTVQQTSVHYNNGNSRSQIGTYASGRWNYQPLHNSYKKRNSLKKRPKSRLREKPPWKKKRFKALNSKCKSFVKKVLPRKHIGLNLSSLYHNLIGKNRRRRKREDMDRQLRCDNAAIPLYCSSRYNYMSTACVAPKTCLKNTNNVGSQPEENSRSASQGSKKRVQFQDEDNINQKVEANGNDVGTHDKKYSEAGTNMNYGDLNSVWDYDPSLNDCSYNHYHDEQIDNEARSPVNWYDEQRRDNEDRSPVNWYDEQRIRYGTGTPVYSFLCQLPEADESELRRVFPRYDDHGNKIEPGSTPPPSTDEYSRVESPPNIFGRDDKVVRDYLELLPKPTPVRTFQPAFICEPSIPLKQHHNLFQFEPGQKKWCQWTIVSPKKEAAPCKPNDKVNDEYNQPKPDMISSNSKENKECNLNSNKAFSKPDPEDKTENKENEPCVKISTISQKCKNDTVKEEALKASVKSSMGKTPMKASEELDKIMEKMRIFLDSNECSNEKRTQTDSSSYRYARKVTEKLCQIQEIYKEDDKELCNIFKHAPKQTLIFRSGSSENSTGNESSSENSTGDESSTENSSSDEETAENSNSIGKESVNANKEKPFSKVSTIIKSSKNLKLSNKKVLVENCNGTTVTSIEAMAMKLDEVSLLGGNCEASNWAYELIGDDEEDYYNDEDLN